MIPSFLFRLYHRTLAVTGALWYGHPSRRLLVIGVTGTTGKSTVCEMLASVFRHAGKSSHSTGPGRMTGKVGVASTIRFQIGDESTLNNEKMTMLGRWRLQKLLRQMANAGCSVVILETTSQGLAQYRHVGIDYDCAVMTNLTPEHIESHGSFAAYRFAKEQLFAVLATTYRKLGIPKVSVVNLAMNDAQDFLRYPADRHVGFALQNAPAPDGMTVFVPDTIKTTERGSTFTVQSQTFHLPLPGTFNVANALAAIAVAQTYDVPLATIASALEAMQGVPGRFEIVVQEPFRVIVDYAHEPAGLEAVYKAVQAFHPQRVIAVLGSTGGGRDRWKRPVLGKIAAQYAQLVIVTNEDPYDEDPMAIIAQVADGAAEAGKRDGENLFRILDRREGIHKALSLAQPGDLIIITGKGSEQRMVVKGGRKIPWSDERVVQDLLSRRSNQSQA